MRVSVCDEPEPEPAAPPEAGAVGAAPAGVVDAGATDAGVVVAAPAARAGEWLPPGPITATTERAVSTPTAARRDRRLTPAG